MPNPAAPITLHLFFILAFLEGGGLLVAQVSHAAASASSPRKYGTPESVTLVFRPVSGVLVGNMVAKIPSCCRVRFLMSHRISSAANSGTLDSGCEDENQTHVYPAFSFAAILTDSKGVSANLQ